MKNTGTLFELIQRLDEFEDSDRAPLVIYAQHGADAGRKSPALVCPRGEGSSLTCPLDPSLSEVLSVEPARVTEGARFKEDLDADSLDLVELVMGLEERFDIEVPEEDLEGIETVGQAYDLVVGKL